MLEMISKLMSKIVDFKLKMVANKMYQFILRMDSYRKNEYVIPEYFLCIIPFVIFKFDKCVEYVHF